MNVFLPQARVGADTTQVVDDANCKHVVGAKGKPSWTPEGVDPFESQGTFDRIATEIGVSVMDWGMWNTLTCVIFFLEYRRCI